jgi:hypothetical protein
MDFSRRVGWSATAPKLQVSMEPALSEGQSGRDLTPTTPRDVSFTYGEQPASSLSTSASKEICAEDLRSEYFADDVTIPENAHAWSEDELRSYFESGGEKVPVRVCASSLQRPPEAGIDLTPAGKGRFTTAPPRVFVTRRGARLVYQLARGERPPVCVIGGGQSGRHEACEQFGAESPALARHSVLIVDRRNCGSSDVNYDGIGSGNGEVRATHERAARAAGPRAPCCASHRCRRTRRRRTTSRSCSSTSPSARGSSSATG